MTYLDRMKEFQASEPTLAAWPAIRRTHLACATSHNLEQPNMCYFIYFWFTTKRPKKLLNKIRSLSPTDKIYYYMALSQKDWELPNSWIWLAEIDIDGGLDFPI